MKHVVNVLSSGQKYLFILLALLILSACSVTPEPTENNQEISQLATIKISATATKAGLEKLYGGKVIMFRPEAGFAILGFTGTSGLQALATEPNAEVTSPEVSAQGSGAWGGGSGAWASGISAWGSGPGAWGSGAGAWGGGAGAWASGPGAWGSGAGAWGSGAGAWGSGNTTIPALPSENRFMFQQIRLPQGQTIAKNFGAGVKIAIIDTGIDLNHPLFTGRLAPSAEWKDFVDNDSTPQEVDGAFYGHGTGIAGLIVQTAPRATILPIRVLGPDGTGNVAKIVLAIDWAIQQGANVINLSLGTNEDVVSFKQAVSAAAQAGVYVVAAVGNEGSSSLLYPAAYMTTATGHEKMLSAGSFTTGLVLSVFCNSNADLEYVAPGELMMSAYPDQRVAQYTGSSFATPIVAGAVALAQGDASAADKTTIELYLKSSSIDLAGYYGKRVDATSLLQAIPGFVPRQALFVTGSATLNSADTKFKARLEGMGYAVTMKTHSSVASTDATGKDVVVISSSVDDRVMLAKMRNATAPVVTWEPKIFDDMSLTSATGLGTTTNQMYTTITSGHPLSAGLGTQPIIYDGFLSPLNTVAWGKPAASATIVATTYSDATKATVFAYDKGTTMIGTFVAPARRVGNFFIDTGSTPTIIGWMLFDSSITWATSGN